MIQVEVIIPLALDGLFSYAVPEALISEAPGFSVGCRVVVPFGGKRYYTGVVFSMDKEAEVTACKEVEQILDATPIIPEATLKQWEWMAYYYFPRARRCFRLWKALRRKAHFLLRSC